MSADISPAEERLGNNSDKDETEGDEDDEIKDTLQRDKVSDIYNKTTAYSAVVYSLFHCFPG